jgi:hypothetical protein
LSDSAFQAILQTPVIGHIKEHKGSFKLAWRHLIWPVVVIAARRPVARIVLFGAAQGGNKPMAKEEEWKDSGVKVTVDDDSADIIPKNYGSPPAPGDFNIIRPLVNFEVKVGSGYPAVPIRFVVCYTASDVSAAGGQANKLRLVWWDQSKNKWKNIPLTGSTSIPAGFSGFEGAFGALINASWPDPPIAWGDGG